MEREALVHWLDLQACCVMTFTNPRCSSPTMCPTTSQPIHVGAIVVVSRCWALVQTPTHEPQLPAMLGAESAGLWSECNLRLPALMQSI